MKESMYASGDTVTVAISDVVYRGKGLARLDGEVIFVPGVLPGETAEVRLTRRHKNFSEASLIEVTHPSPQRTAPACPLAAQCPGCCYQHMDYTEEVRLKQAQFANLLQRQARIAADITLPAVPSPRPLEYRNKISLHSAGVADSVRLGYVGEDNVTVIDVPACPLAQPALNEYLGTLRADSAFMNQLRTRRSLTLRCTRQDGVIHFFGSTGISGAWLTETTMLGKVLVPRGSFFQVNHGVADQILSTVVGILKSTAARTVVDLYCGVGVFALAAGIAGVKRVIGIDYDETGIQAARRNADDRGLKGMEFMAQPAVRGIRQALRRVDPSDTLLIVDPPRTGLEKKTVETIVQARPAEILYVSCAADTLARDIALLGSSGYHATSAQLFDMFPRTPYFESITRLTAGQAKS